MKIRLNVDVADLTSATVTVTAEGTATVGDVAAALLAGATRRPSDPTRPLTLRVVTDDQQELATLSARSLLAETSLCSGQRVEVIDAADDGTGHGPQTAAWLRVISGPLAGQSFPLRSGPYLIGRDQSCDIMLDDHQVSRRHARLTVGARIEITDLNSSNGVIVGDSLVDHAVVGPRDVVIVGDSGLVVEPTGDQTSGPSAAVGLDFNRSPVVRPPYEGRQFQAPQPPAPTTPGKFPLVAMIAPLLMGVVMFLFTRNPMSVIFIALSPVIAVGTWLDRKMTDRKASAQTKQQFVDEITALGRELSQALDEEHLARCAETPTVGALVEAAYGLTPDLWSRRIVDDDFLTLNLGYGTAPSRQTLELPSRGQAPAELWAAVSKLQRDTADIDDVPITVGLRDCGNLGLSGERSWLDPVARGLIAQLACLHSPAELVLGVIASTQSSSRWQWLMWLPHVGSTHSPLPGAHLANSPGAVSALVSSVEELAADRQAAGHNQEIHRPAVVLMVEDDAPVERGRLVALAANGPAVGVHLLWLAERQDRLPAACRAYLARDDKTNRVAAGFVDQEQTSAITRVDPLPAAAADGLARQLSPVTDAGAPVLDQSDLPRAVSYLALAGHGLADGPEATVDRWREGGSLRGGPPPRGVPTLRALVGQGPQGEFVLDLRAQGPHALVGGTTGAGKSEFLQSWILGLAAAHSPYRATFLFVDYKGGAAFADCVRL
ncbi:MAG: FHA domain-containing protein, partial [Propionibacteriaceae bacterium]|nr:FHA domain-containing protein [Propionibacteriaceae bacterium]